MSGPSLGDRNGGGWAQGVEFSNLIQWVGTDAVKNSKTLADGLHGAGAISPIRRYGRTPALYPIDDYWPALRSPLPAI